MVNSLRRLRKKIINSLMGFWISLKEEKSLLAYVIIFPFLIGLGFLLRFSILEWTIVILIMFLTYAIEVLNTALEAAVDAISFEYNIKVKKIKDIAAGATLIVTIGLIICLSLIYIPNLIDFFGRIIDTNA